MVTRSLTWLCLNGLCDWSSNRSILPRNLLSKRPLPGRALDSGLRRNDVPAPVKRCPPRSTRSIWPLVFVGTVFLLASCSVTVQTVAPRATPTVVGEAQLIATATAVAPSAPEMLERLAQECRRYGKCDGPKPWNALVLALEQRPLQLPDLAPGDACPAPHIRSIDGYPFEVIGDGPLYSLFYLLIIRSDRTNNAYEQDGWYWNKVVWARDPQHRGPVVMRGRQLNGPEILRFQNMRDGDPSPELAHASLHVPRVYRRQP